MTEKILITGISGRLGTKLAGLLKKDYTIAGLDVKKSGIASIDRNLIIGDVRDKKCVAEALEGVDAVVHAAAQLSIDRSFEDPAFDAEINGVGTINVLDCARKIGKIKRFVYLSTSSVYGEPKYLPVDEKHPLEPISPYGMSKLIGEQYGFAFNRLFNMPFVCLRPFNMYCEGEDPQCAYSSAIAKFAWMAKNNITIDIHGTGEQLRDFVHITDVARFVKTTMENEAAVGNAYNLGSGKPISIINLAKSILKAAGKDGGGNIIHSASARGKIAHSYADIRKAAALGYRTEISIDEGIARVINYYK